MMKTSDKLSASVRQAKAAQAPAEAQPADAGSVKPAAPKPAARATTRPGTSRAKPPASRTAEARIKTPTRPAAVPAPARSDEIPESGTTLFPSRIWPD